ncbi:MAG TPA: FAD-dependent oxidoreductase [Ramlibacter sp.]|nr:FAD-dependent oxidoreductase [Ramlibacter sp.]
MSRTDHVLIVGAGHAGGRVAQHLLEFGHTGRITLVGEETHAPYERPALSKELLTGEREAAELTLAPAEFWTQDRIERRVARVTAIDGTTRTARLSTGEVLAFDRLVVATGGGARRLQLPGADLPGVHVLRTIDDSLALRAALAARPQRLVVIGGGVIGMEAAAAARGLGHEVTVLEAGPRIMARCVPAAGSAWLAQLHRSQGVRLEEGVRLQQLQRDGEQLRVDYLDAQGAAVSLPADHVLVAVGISPATDFLAASGVSLQDGVLTDEYGRSVSADWCYAVGDVANSHNPVYGRGLRLETWRNAENQARAVAAALVGEPEAYAEVPWMWTDQFGHNIQVVGLCSPHDVVITRAELEAEGGLLLWMRDGRVAGGMLVDCGRERKQLEALVRRAAQVSGSALADASLPLKALA